jgi:YHS domain-containing protein
MKKLYTFPIIVLTASLFMTAIPAERAMAAQKITKVQSICPVMGDPIDKKYFIDYKGKRIYFCCASCPDEFKKNPEKYMKKLRESGVTLEKAPAVKKSK